MRNAITMKTSTLYSIFLLLPPALCHMEMSWPYPLHSKYNPANNYENVDYSMTSPLNADGSNFPCKGYQNDRPIDTVITYTAGSTYNMSLAGSATHGGGSCQLSLSYDNGATFRVIKSMIGGCPLASTYDFTIPSYAPSGNALLAWTWQNLEGNREFYMNCAEVNIIDSSSSSKSRRNRRRQAYSTFDSLPYIWKANIPDVNDCTTTEEVNVVYPDPGPDVVYGDGLSSSSPATEGDCDAPTSYGQTYKDLGDTSASVASGYAQTSAVAASSSADDSTATAYATPSSDNNAYNSVPESYDDSSPDNSSLATTSYASYAVQRAAAETQSTTTVTMDCPDTVIVTITMSPSTATITATGSSAPVTATTSDAPAASTPAASQPTTSNTNTPGYASEEDIEPYLPCVPGTFICTSASTWYTCDYNDGSDTSAGFTAYIYDYPRDVSAGMECLSYLSPYSSDTQQYAQQGQTESGYYRDDRVVRARPDGDCSDEGSIQCTDGGQQFDMCDQGGWVEMGAVANGTMCENGEIVSSS